MFRRGRGFLIPVGWALALAVNPLEAWPQDGVSAETDGLHVCYQEGLLEIRAERIPLRRVLAEIGREAEVEIACEGPCTEPVTATVSAVPLDEALHALLAPRAFVIVMNSGQPTKRATIRVLPAEGAAPDPATVEVEPDTTASLGTAYEEEELAAGGSGDTGGTTNAGATLPGASDEVAESAAVESSGSPFDDENPAQYEAPISSWASASGPIDQADPTLDPPAAATTAGPLPDEVPYSAAATPLTEWTAPDTIALEVESDTTASLGTAYEEEELAAGGSGDTGGTTNAGATLPGASDEAEESAVPESFAGVLDDESPTPHETAIPSQGVASGPTDQVDPTLDPPAAAVTMVGPLPDEVPF